MQGIYPAREKVSDGRDSIMTRLINKVWGHEEVLVSEPEYTLKILAIQPGFTSSLHYHPIKKETFYCTKGVCDLVIEDQWYRLVRGDQMTILPGQKHRFELGKWAEEPCVIYEV